MSVANRVQKVARWFPISSGAIDAVHNAANVLALADLWQHYSSLTT
jgi:hypothetical protein